MPAISIIYKTTEKRAPKRNISVPDFMFIDGRCFQSYPSCNPSKQLIQFTIVTKTAERKKHIQPGIVAKITENTTLIMTIIDRNTPAR